MAEWGVEILSTGGTARVLRDAGVAVIDVADVTGFPEMMEGRVKTLHPNVHGGILADRSKSDHLIEAEEHGISLIDLVCVNLYPFAKTVARAGVTIEDAIENIDIGGPAMIRSAAKNHAAVTVVVDPKDYAKVLKEMANNAGEVPETTRRRLAVNAFGHTAYCDATIHNYLHQQFASNEFPEHLTPTNELAAVLRYGENPHQAAAFYRDTGVTEPCVGTARQIGGKELSHNNILDANAALELVKEFDDPACAIIKHANPCGCALAPDLVTAFQHAHEADPVSAFGGIVACNRTVDAAAATAMTAEGNFFEVVIAPDFSPEALEIITSRKGWGQDVRLLNVPNWNGAVNQQDNRAYELKKVTGGLLVQQRDLHDFPPDNMKRVSLNQASGRELNDLVFAWQVVKHVKSNAIVLVHFCQVIGVGAGQMNRVQSVELALEQATHYAGGAQGAVMASDAFFPFPDGPKMALEAGITAIIQPGGSKKDAETIDVVDEHKAVMFFTGVRHFRH